MLLCGLCHAEAFAHGYNRGAQTNSWGYQPIYSSSIEKPDYQFRTTSLYMSALGDTEYGSSLSCANAPRRTSPWDWDEDDNALGELDDPVPVGDTPWIFMLLLAAGFIAFRYRKI